MSEINKGGDQRPVSDLKKIYLYLWMRTVIRMFLDLPDPDQDPLVRGTGTDPDPIIVDNDIFKLMMKIARSGSGSVGTDPGSGSVLKFPGSATLDESH
jgi:hypothetical protein